MSSFKQMISNGDDVSSAYDLRPGECARLPKSAGYRLGLVFAVLALPVFPLLYLGALAVPLWLLHLFPLHGHSVMRVTRFGSGLHPFRLSWILPYLLPYMAVFLLELSLLLSVVRPLFAMRVRRASGIAIDAQTQPDLWSFVLGICEWMGVAAPKCIEVDCGLNATVHFSPQRLSFLKRDLTLKIGLPLVAALSARELAGIIGHELGHFRQGSGLRLSYLVRGINRWLARAVAQRDELDTWLERESHYAQWRYPALLLDLASLTVSFSRQCLRVLMFPNQVASSFLLRQMEHDADRYEIKLAGSGSFEATTHRLAILAEAAKRAQMEMQAMWRIGRHLPDNFPLLVLQCESKLPVGIRDMIETHVRQGRGRLLDSHPPDAERLSVARKANEPGVWRLDAPASALFSDFDSLARQATFAHYVQELGLHIDSTNLRRVNY